MKFKEQLLFIGAFVLLFTYNQAITVSSNGNSPMKKMISIDSKNIEFGGFVPINPYKETETQQNYITTEKKYLNHTDLPVNERYRRLIPYMTFYLANDFNNPQNEVYSPKSEAQRTSVPSNGKLTTSQYSNIPRYRGNRLTYFNIASASPNKLTQDYYPRKHSNGIKYNYNQNSQFSVNHHTSMQGMIHRPPKQSHHNNFEYQQPIRVPVKVNPSNFYNTPETPKVQYYVNPESRPKPQQYKLVPYEQTPPVQIPDPINNEDYFIPKANPYSNKPIPVPVVVEPVSKNTYFREPNYYQPQSGEQHYNVEQKQQNEVYSYSPITEDQFQKNNQVVYQPVKKYEIKRPSINFNPVTESGFQPMANTAIPSTQTKYVYKTSSPYTPVETESDYEDYGVSTQKPQPVQYKTKPTERPIYYTESPEEYADISPNLNYESSTGDIYEQNNLVKILKSLQNSHSIPQTITTDNIDASIKTLVQILNNLKNNQNYVASSTPATALSTPTPFKPPPKLLHNDVQAPRYSSRVKPNNIARPIPKPLPVHENPSQDLEEDHPRIHGLGSNQDYLAGENELGGTPGKPGIDYPILSVIPPTQFDCKTQRYKGFFGDPETNCQVWHYCDLNGGQASFLCPNGTIFSQVALTCDWWFNVKCASTPQLYVLNERLYKYILPYTPKFPEDYSGPLVDKYLTIKYKEMEQKLKKIKGSKSETDEETDMDTETETERTVETEKVGAAVEINTSGMSGAIRPFE